MKTIEEQMTGTFQRVWVSSNQTRIQRETHVYQKQFGTKPDSMFLMNSKHLDGMLWFKSISAHNFLALHQLLRK